MTAAAPHCAEFEVTNAGKEPVTYTISFTFLSSSGEALINSKRTVPAVKPGRTVRRTITARDLRGVVGGNVRVKILKVRSVPTDEAPSYGGTCPASGTRIYANEDAEAAMGLRVLGFYFVNCGTRTNRLNGYPRLQLLGESHKPVRGVKVLRGGGAITAGPTGADGTAKPLMLKPGQRAYAALVWRNTFEAGDAEPVNIPYVRVWAKPGTAPVMLTPELDLGSTGKLGVGPWKKE